MTHSAAFESTILTACAPLVVVTCGKPGQMVQDSTMASVNTTREEHHEKKEDECDTPYYDAAVEAVAE